MLPVVFDLDGTLIDSLPDIAAAVNVLLAEEGLPGLEVPQVAGFIGHGVQVLMQRLIAATDLEERDRERLLARSAWPASWVCLDWLVALPVRENQDIL